MKPGYENGRLRKNFTSGIFGLCTVAILCHPTKAHAQSKPGWHFQRSVAGPDASEAANFSLLNTKGKQTVYNADFAVIYNSPIANHDDFSFTRKFSVESSVASDDSDSEDALRLRYSVVLDKALDPDATKAIYLTSSVKLESDKNIVTEKVSAEFELSPTFDRYKIGRRVSLGPFGFRWRPFLGMDVGSAFGEQAGYVRGSERKATIFRMRSRLRAEVYLRPLTRVLKIKEERLFLFVDNTAQYLPLENKKTFNFFVSGLNLFFTDNVALALTYKKGQCAPNFNTFETTSLAFGLRF